MLTQTEVHRGELDVSRDAPTGPLSTMPECVNDSGTYLVLSLFEHPFLGYARGLHAHMLERD